MTDTASLTTDDTTVSPFRASVQDCLDEVVAKYNTSSLTEPQEIRDWLRCFDTDANSILSAEEICSTLNCTALGMTSGQIISQMDADGDGSVNMAEFDSDLQSYGTSTALPALGVRRLIGLWMATIVAWASWDAGSL
ncbi:Calmodulin-like protein 5 [Picochlorum sp. SENEW3]|nr:Calmodulin-like protein 5 [Picochlorum sp. SENEW3]